MNRSVLCLFISLITGIAAAYAASAQQGTPKVTVSYSSFNMTAGDLLRRFNRSIAAPRSRVSGQAAVQQFIGSMSKRDKRREAKAEVRCEALLKPFNRAAVTAMLQLEQCIANLSRVDETYALRELGEASRSEFEVEVLR